MDTTRGGNQDQKPGYRVTVPVTFFEINRDVAGEFDVPANEVALVLVDTWNSGDPKEGEEPSQKLRDMQSFLHTCRDHGLAIIHAPNHPVVDKYPQYHTIKETVENDMRDYPTVSESPPFLNWPPRDNDVYKAARQLRKDARASAASEIARYMKDRDISRFLRPLEDELVLASHNEFRYVLWKRGIKLLLYMGGSLAECMQHRDTGINFLAGIDSQRTGFGIVVLEDCSSAGPTQHFDGKTMSKAMLDYFKRKITFVANSKDVAFIPVREELR